MNRTDDQEFEEASEIETAEPAQAEEAFLDRVSVKDGSRIHIIHLNELLYLQAGGDYVTLFTPDGQFVKEQTMKYFETHLPPTVFVRIHRSCIVNTEQILRVELFGKENYQVRLKNGVCLRASNGGYKLLKERLSL
jgi:DNA-binding LytR/AlgR family response regulator